MNEPQPATAPRWFMIASIMFLLWNLFGAAVFAATMTIFTDEEALAEAGLNEAQIELTLSTPTWVNVAFGVAVIFGVLGCIALVMKKKAAVPLLIISLLGVAAQNTYMYLLSDAVQVMGVGASPLVIVAAIALVPFAVFGANKGWLQ